MSIEIFFHDFKLFDDLLRTMAFGKNETFTTYKQQKKLEIQLFKEPD